MTGTRHLGVAALALVALLLAVDTACVPYEPLPRAQTFVLPGVHAKVGCVECHGAGPPFFAFVWDTTCLSCHEPDRKAVDHYAGLGCASQGICHSDTDPTWLERLGGGGGTTTIDHDFLPLEGGHAIDCTLCHTGTTPGLNNVTPLGATSQLCWSCHEDKRFFTGHYVYGDDELPAGAELRRDCKACHDDQSRYGTPVGGEYLDWDRYGTHNEIRFPHGMELQGVPADDDDWITECTDCHTNGTPIADDPSYVCTEACHDEIFEDPQRIEHSSFTPGSNDTSCKVCHVYADIRQP